MAKNTKIAAEISELTQDAIAEVAGGPHNLYKSPAKPHPGYLSRLSIKRALRAAVLAVSPLLFAFLAEATQPSDKEIDKTSDNQWWYRITSRDASRWGGNKPSEYITNSICGPQNAETDVDNGLGGRLKTHFSGDWNYCGGIVQVAKDWESWSPRSWFLFHDIIIYNDQKVEVARLEIGEPR